MFLGSERGDFSSDAEFRQILADIQSVYVLMERRISGKFVFAFHGIPPLRDQYSDYRAKGF